MLVSIRAQLAPALLDQHLLLYQVPPRLLFLIWDYTFCQSEKQGNYFYLSVFLLPNKQNPFLSHSCFPRTQDGLRPIGNLQLTKDVRDMIAHRLQAEHQVSGNFFIGMTLRDQRKNLYLALCQFRKNLGWRNRTNIGKETH